MMIVISNFECVLVSICLQMHESDYMSHDITCLLANEVKCTSVLFLCSSDFYFYFCLLFSFLLLIFVMRFIEQVY